MKKTLSLIVVLTLALIIADGAFAKNFNLKFASLFTAKDPYGQHSIRFAKAVEKATNGSIKITFYFRSKLGVELDVIKQVSRGRIDMGGFSLAGASSMVPELSLLGTSYLFDSYPQNDCVLDNHLADRFAKMFDKKGLKLISYIEAGTASVFGKKPIITPADAKDWKLRITQAKFSVLMWQSVGAIPVPLPVSEHHAALQTGLVDGGDYTPIIYIFLGFNKLAPYLTLTQHSIQPGFYLLSKKTWNQFSEVQKKQFMGAVEPPAGVRKQVRGLEVYLTEKYKKAGGPVHYLTSEQKQMWRDAVIPHQEKIIDMVGGQSAMIWKKIQEGKAACGR